MPQNDFSELMHYGILGMKWGVRRYQNPDGTLTAAGKKRYGKNRIPVQTRKVSSMTKRANDYANKILKGIVDASTNDRVGTTIKSFPDSWNHFMFQQQSSTMFQDQIRQQNLQYQQMNQIHQQMNYNSMVMNNNMLSMHHPF